jgi:hypothetical protein
LKKIYLLSFVYLLCNNVLMAQEQLITYHGQFRTLLSDNRLRGNLLNGDSLSSRRGALGTMFLDLGVTVKPTEDFKLVAEFRMRNVIGQNNQQQVGGVSLTSTNTLIDTRMIFRQVRAEGVIRKIIHYQIGDINLGLTKYTLFNNNDVYSDFEADIYKERRVIPHYENFQTDNMWRLQGLSAKTQINLRGPIRRIDLNLFGTRTRQNNGDAVPDRFIIGGKAEITQSKYLTVGANWISMFDVPGSTYDSLQIPYNYNNQVLTGNYKITPYNKGNIEINILGEGGFSKNRYYIALADSTSHKSDFFVDAGLRAFYKPRKIQLTASYINVGYNFTSPGAQTLRLRPTSNPLYFQNINNNTATRDLTIYDRYSDDYIYNQRIQPGLMKFIPVYGNVLPYGAATPNRSGLVYNFERSIDTSNVFSWNVGGAALSEIVSEGDSTTKKLRKFIQIKGGASFNISKVIGFSKIILISAGGRYENTSREGAASVNFSSSLADLGLTIEVFRSIYLLGGYKYLQGKGTELITNRDQFGSISGYAPYIYNIDQSVISGGIKLGLFRNSFASIEYNKLTVTNRDDSTRNYSLGNFFINVTMRF